MTKNKTLFDQHGPRSVRIAAYFVSQMKLRLLSVSGNEISGEWTLRQIFDLSKDVAQTFQLDEDDTFDEITDYLDSTIWANEYGGVNDPTFGPRNRFYAARLEARNDTGAA